MGVQGCPLLCCITPVQEGGSQQSSPHMATSLSGLWRGGCQDSQDGGMGWARGLLPVPPSPNCRRGGDVGSCSTKPCSFSPLKPDYLAVPVCLRACSGGRRRRRNFTTTSVCSHTGPSCPGVAPGTAA